MHKFDYTSTAKSIVTTIVLLIKTKGDKMEQHATISDDAVEAGVKTPRDRVNDLVADIFRAEDYGGDYKYLPDEAKQRIEATALFLVLEGWTK